MELTGRVKTAFLRGAVIFNDGKIVGPARGEYLTAAKPDPTSAVKMRFVIVRQR